MFRRCASLLMIAGFLASHTAVVPHAHGVVSAAEQQEHNSAPHFHLDWFIGHDSHSHDHPHGEQHRHSQRRSDGSGELPEDLLSLGAGGQEHDATAIYVPQITVSLRADEITPANQSPSPMVAALPQNSIWGDESWGAVRRIWHPPDKVCDGSNLYLTIRQFRI